MGQFKITQDEGLAGKLAYLQQQWRAMKERQPVTLYRENMFYYSSPEVFRSDLNAYGMGGSQQKELYIKMKFQTTDGSYSTILPEIKVNPSRTDYIFRGGLKRARKEGDIFYYEGVATIMLVGENVPDFTATVGVFSAKPGIFTARKVGINEQ